MYLTARVTPKPDVPVARDDREDGQMPAPDYLIIEPNSPSGDVIMAGYTDEGRFSGDTWHATLDEAKKVAHVHYGTPIDAWEEISRPQSIPETALIALLDEACLALQGSTATFRDLRNAYTFFEDLLERCDTAPPYATDSVRAALHRHEAFLHTLSFEATWSTSIQDALLDSAHAWKTHGASMLVSRDADEEQLNELQRRDGLHLALHFARSRPQLHLHTEPWLPVVLAGDDVLRQSLRASSSVTLPWLPWLRSYSTPPPRRWWWYLDRPID